MNKLEHHHIESFLDEHKFQKTFFPSIINNFLKKFWNSKVRIWLEFHKNSKGMSITQTLTTISLKDAPRGIRTPDKPGTGNQCSIQLSYGRILS